MVDGWENHTVSASCHAWVDESIHVTARVPIYLLAAVVADDLAGESLRHDLRRLVRRPRQRLHWRDEEYEDRMAAVTAIAKADLSLIVVVGTPLDPRRQERARRKCMERLFNCFRGVRGLDTVWIESRTVSLNQADEHMVVALRGSRVIDATVRCQFALSSSDPMLWPADVVAGAVGASYRGEPVYRGVLDPHLVVDEVDLVG